MEPRNKGSKTRQILGIMGAALAIGIIVANANSIYGLLSAVFPITSSGVITSAGINVYKESQCLNNVTSINWGTLSPGGSTSVTVYVKNTGSVNLTLSMRTDSWTPAAASTYLTLTWNYAGGQLKPNDILAVTFTLTVSGSITGISSYSFNIYITGTQV
jgi:archaellum component FlaG (FlaF/FlaG flagellin family)